MPINRPSTREEILLSAKGTIDEIYKKYELPLGSSAIAFVIGALVASFRLEQVVFTAAEISKYDFVLGLFVAGFTTLHISIRKTRNEQLDQIREQTNKRIRLSK